MREHQIKKIAIASIILVLGFSGRLLAQDQVSDVKVFHNEGQTFITWKEPGEPPVKDDATDKAVRDKKDSLVKSLQFKVYRSDKKITSVDGLTPVGQAGPLSCWNWTYYGANDRVNKPEYRYVIKEGAEPLANGTGLYVHNPKQAGKAFYAVTIVKDGKENTSITDANSTADAVDETVGLGVPVLQKKEKVKDFNYVPDTELHYYVRWDAPPNASKENYAVDYLVGVPKNPDKPKAAVAVMLHCWGGSQFGGYGWWQQHMKADTTYLIASTQVPYDWWTGYNEYYWDTRGMGQDAAAAKLKTGKIYPYSTNRMLAFLDWAAKKYDLDINRAGVCGVSMGGSGSVMFAVRYPERFGWCVSWVGVHNAGGTPHFKGSYEGCYGKFEWALPFEDGTNVWDHYNDAWYLRKHPEKSLGLIMFSNGKDDSAIGWEQAVEFLQAMQETKQPHVFEWGLNGHTQRVTLPVNGQQNVVAIDVRLDRSLPAFTKCSLDDNPGTAKKLDTPKEDPVSKKKDSFDGDSSGQINRYLYWKTDDIVDDAGKWEMTVGLIEKAPKDECTVDITPRRCQKFKPKAGDKFKWVNKDSDGKEITSGEVTADANGLVTIEKVAVTKKCNRISISTK